MAYESEKAMTHLFIHLLGPFEANLNEVPLTQFRSDKVRALLAFLCVESDGAHRREKLAGLLWPDFPETRARTNLRRTLSDLRDVIDNRLEPGNALPSANLLRITRQTIQFNLDSDAWVDVQTIIKTLEASHPTIADLEAGVACCRGEFMAGFSLPDNTVFEEWLLFQRERFSRLTLDALGRLAEAYATEGAYARALPHAWRQIKLDPLCEKAHRQLMRLLAYDGQTSKALAQYEACRELLLEEIGIEPSEETAALYRKISNGELPASGNEKIRLPAFLLEEEALEDEPAVFVDRENELTWLDQSLDQVLAGQGHVIFIIGEPGSGKTILASEFIRQAMRSNSELLAVIGRCNAYTGFGDPYLPFREMLGMLTGDIETRWAGGEITGQHAQRLWGGLSFVLKTVLGNGQDLIDRLLPGVSLLARTHAVAPSLAAQLNALLEGRALYRSEKDKLQQTDLFEQYTKVLQAISHKHPLILMVDDLQWADPGSIGLLFHLGRRLRGSKILVIGAFRPEEVALGRLSADSVMERHPLETVIHEFQRDFGEIIIDLSETEGRGFVEAFIDSEPNCLDSDFRKVFYQHTNGHPLFSVELLRGLQARGDLIKDRSGRWMARSDLNWKTLPARVEAVVDERIKRLPEDWRSILATASIEGEVFTAEAVARVMEIDEDRVLGCLSGPLTHKHHLVQAQGLEWLGDHRLSYYRFRHFLFQKYLYDQFDPVQRAHLHHRMGSALIDLHGEKVEDLSVILAWHFEVAGMKSTAAEYLLRAGKRAVEMFAYDEAITHLKHGLDLIETLPETLHRDQLEISLLLALGLPFGAVKGPTDVKSEQIYGRVKQLTQNIEPSIELFQALLGLKEYYDLRLELQTALQIGHEMRKLAEYLDKPELLVLAHHGIGVTFLYSGRAEDFLKQQQQMLALYNSDYGNTLVEILGYDLLADTLIGTGWALWFLGYADQSEESYKKVFDLISEAGQPYIANAFMSAAYHYVSLSEVAHARDMAEKAITLSREHGFSFWLGGTFGPMGWVLGEEGHLEEGINMIHDGLTILKDIGSWLLYQQELSLLAETYLKAGKISEGLAVIEEALTMVRDKGFLLEEPEIHRIKGELLLSKGGASDEAQVCFHQAIEIARRLRAKSWELRATMSLCRLWQSQGKGKQAKALLIDIYGWFTEGFGYTDLQEAKTLLEGLG